MIVVWSHFFVCPFFNTITNVGKIAFRHHQEKCPRGGIPPSTQQAVHRIVLMPCLVIHHAIKHLRQHSLHTPLFIPLAVPHIVVATTTHTVKATSRAEVGPSRAAVGAYLCKADFVVDANVVVLLMPLPLLPQSLLLQDLKTKPLSLSLRLLHSSHPQPVASSVAIGVDLHRTTKDDFLLWDRLKGQKR